MKKKIQFTEIIQHNKWLHLLALVIFPVCIYIQSVKFDYTYFDDNGIIKDKFAIVGNIKNIDTLLKVDAFFNATGDFYRPVQNLSFMLDAQVSGEDLWMFHTTNLLIHIFTGIALYFFLQLLRLKRLTAFLLALLFAVHPLFASGVGWVPSRGDILIGLWGLLLFISFHKYFTGTKKLLWFIIHSLLFLVTIFTKETTILFPLLLFYYYFFVLQQPNDFKFIKDAKKVWPFPVVWIACSVLYLWLRHGVSANSGATQDVLGISPFFKNNTVIPTIIGKFFVPFHLSTYPLYDNLSTITGLFFLIGLLYLTYYYSREKKWAVLMGLLWFLFFAVPPTIYRLENADTFFNYLEHRTYLPMTGIVFITGFYLNDKLDEAAFRKYFKWVYAPVIVLFSILAFIHCADYKNMAATRDRAAKLNNPSALAGRASDRLAMADTVNALIDINKAIELNPKDGAMYFERGKIRSRLQQHEEAEQDFSLALNLIPNAVDVLMARSLEKRILKKYAGAARDIFKAAGLDSTNPKIFYSFGNLLIATQNYSNAIGAFSRAISLYPAYGEAYNNRAYAKILSGDAAGALKDCYTAVSLMPENPIVYNNSGRAYSLMNQPDSALGSFTKALALNPGFADAYFERGMAMQKNNHTDSACKDWAKAQQLGYSDSTGMLEKHCRK